MSYNSQHLLPLLSIFMPNGAVPARYQFLDFIFSHRVVPLPYYRRLITHSRSDEQLVGPIFQSLADELTEIKFVKVDTDKHEDKGRLSGTITNVSH
jgi:hypothetical protein